MSSALRTQTNGAGEHVLGPVSQIPVGEGRDFVVGGTSVAVFRLRSGTVYAAQSACPHRGGPLADGLLGGTTVVCPLHAWKFDLRTGEVLMGSCPITVYPIRLTDAGDIVLTLTGQGEHPAPGDRCDAPGYPIFAKEGADGRPLPFSGA